MSPAALGTGDERGPLADAGFTLTVPSRVALTIRPVAPSPGTDLLDPELISAVDLQGPTSSSMMTLSVSGDRLQIDTQRLEPGDYVLRLAHDGGAMDVTLEEISPEPSGASTRVETSPPTTRGPALDWDGHVTVTVPPPPTPEMTWLRVEGGHDLSLTWDVPPSDELDESAVALGIDYPNGERYCHRSPCSMTRVAPGLYGVYAFPQDQPIEVQARLHLLELPPLAGTLVLGQPITVQTQAPTPDDPRGGMAELELEVTEPGAYLVTAQVTEGWSVDTSDERWFETAPDLSRVEVFSEPDGDPVYGPNLLTSGEALRTGTTHHVVDIEAPGRFVVRVGGEGQEPRQLEVRVVRQGDIQRFDAPFR